VIIDIARSMGAKNAAPATGGGRGF
jgi:hypothetical protein